ncbi:MAG: tetratricopeptide repeat protein, partial [Chitinophagales bacterium]
MNDNIQQRIDYFTNNDKHTGYQDFLNLAAQPLLFSSDLLYKLWLNFKAYRNKNPKQQAKYFVVSDLLLSSLCRPVGADLFCMEEDIRKYLLNQLQPKQKKAVAQFVAEYAKRNKSKLLANIYEVYYLWATGILQPKKMEEIIMGKLQNKTIGDHQKANYLSLYFNTLDIAEEDKEMPQQKLNISLAYAQNQWEENVLKVVLPLELRRKINLIKGISSIKIILLYHHTDEIHSANLQKHLVLLKKQVPELKIWTCKETYFGNLRDVLKNEIGIVKRIVYLLSIDALTDARLYGMVADAQYKNTAVSPVLVRACGYENDFLVKNLPILPSNKIPISQAKGTDEIWKQIAHKLVSDMGGELEPIHTTSVNEKLYGGTYKNELDSKNIMTGEVKNIELMSVGANTTINYSENRKKLPKELTVRLPRQNLQDIIGQRAILRELHQYLFKGKQVVLLNGMGGVGKTTVATTYVAEYYDKYQHIAWVTQSGEDLVDSFIRTEGLLKHFDISLLEKKPEEVFIELMNCFKSIESQPCLLVIDDAQPSLEEYMDYLPTQPHWHILATSREYIQGFNLVTVGFLTEKQAVALFKKHYTRQKLNEDFLRELVSNLDYHTLAIEILAKTAQRNQISPQKLLTALQTDLKAGVYTSHSGKKVERLLSYLCSVFEEQKLNDNEVHLLLQFACLPIRWHSYELLNEFLEFPNAELAKVLASLRNSGLLLYQEANDRYKLHRIVGEVIVKTRGLTLDKISYLVRIITEKLAIDETKDNPIDKFVWIPFGKAILHFFEESNQEDIVRLQNNLGLVLQQFGDYLAAKKLLEKVVLSEEQNFGENHFCTAISYSDLAMVLRDLGDYIGAKTLLEKAVISHEQNLDENHPYTVKIYSNLAMVLRDLGAYASANKLLEKAVISNEQNFGESH